MRAEMTDKQTDTLITIGYFKKQCKQNNVHVKTMLSWKTTDPYFQ